MSTAGIVVLFVIRLAGRRIAARQRGFDGLGAVPVLEKERS